MQIVWSRGQLPESELVKQVTAGDSAAGEAFVNRYGRLIAHCVARGGVTASDREDVCQQVYVHLWDKNCHRLKAWRGDASLSSFLARVVSRLALDHARRVATSPETPGVHTGAEDGEGEEWEGRGDARFGAKEFPVEVAVEMGWQRSALSHALDSLSERDIRLLLLRHWDGLSYQGIAESLGWTVNHVGVALSNAEHRYRKVLLADAPELFAKNSLAGFKKISRLSDRL